MATKKTTNKPSGKNAKENVSNEVPENTEEKLRPVPIDSTRFETTFYGEVGVVLLAFADKDGFARDGVFVVSVKEPHGMAMTEQHRRMIGCHQVRLPLLLH